MPISSSRNRLTQQSRSDLDTENTPHHAHEGSTNSKSNVVSNTPSSAKHRETTKSAQAHIHHYNGPSVKSAKESIKSHTGASSSRDNISRETIKPRRVTLPHIQKLRNENTAGRSLSHDSAVNQRIRAYRHHTYEKPRSVHHPDSQANTSKSSHHPGQRQSAHQHHKKRRAKLKKEKEGDDITLRNIRYFSSHPDPAPLTICLSYPGVEMTHKELLDAIQSSGTIDAEDIHSIQFVDMNCILGTAGVDNRWLITVKDFDARYLLLRDCIWINDDPLHFRLLDEVNMEDYKEYKRRMATLESDAHVSAVERLLAMHNQQM